MPKRKNPYQILLLILTSIALLLLGSTGGIVLAEDSLNNYDPYLSYVIDKGILRGYPDGSYKLDEPVTRSEMVALLSRAVNAKEEKSRIQSYKDIDGKHWAKGAIEVAKIDNLMKTNGNDYFKPEQKMKRIKAVELLEEITNSTTVVTIPGDYHNSRLDNWMEMMKQEPEQLTTRRELCTGIAIILKTEVFLVQ